MPNFIARKYRYANGVIYRENIYTIYEADENGEPTGRGIGGAVVLKSKTLAFAGHPGLCQEPVQAILKHADRYAWAPTLKEALVKIKPDLKCE